ncbi:MAG: hypothetical protein ACQEQV_07070 [Fibrobacterota bacterium]
MSVRGSFTVVDPVVQQAIHPVLNHRDERIFSDSGFGFRLNPRLHEGSNSKWFREITFFDLVGKRYRLEETALCESAYGRVKGR